VAWAFVRPEDPTVLSGRPLLDIGTGDGQTLRAVTEPQGLVLGVERSFDVLRAAALDRAVCAEAGRLPVSDEMIAAVLAADLFHHLGNDELSQVLAEALRVLERNGRLVAWWYEEPATPAPDAPLFPRPYGEVAEALARAGFTSVGRLRLRGGDEGPPTVGVQARR
jgi:ubiquinone/menaquinone biosynthesis C-methylase UbiE